MEVQLSTAATAIAADTFVSLRVGDVQKQSRLAGSRTYHFPATGDGRGRFGRIEVFKRVGDLTVDLSKQDGSQQNVEVPCSIPGLDSLSMGVMVTGGQPGAGKEAVKPPSKNKSKWDAAQKYISQYNLEEVLAEAMREVIREKPEDPFGFLSELMLKKRPVAPIQAVQQVQLQSSAPPVAQQQAPPMQMQAPMQMQVVSQPVVAAAAPERPFKFRPSVGSWLAARPAGDIVAPVAAPVAASAPPAKADDKSFSAYYQQNICTAKIPDTLYKSFAPPAKPPAAPAAPVIPFPLRPSVGAWLAAKPQYNILKKVEDALKVAELEKVPFHQKPSVGTWLASKPLVSPPPVNRHAGLPFRQQPSVGTWYGALPLVEPPNVLGLSIQDLAHLPVESLISSFRAEVMKRDAEIEELRKRSAR